MSFREWLVGVSERHYVPYVLAVFTREIIRGRRPLPYRPDFPGRDAYLRDLGRWNELRMRMIGKDEARLLDLAVANLGCRVTAGPFAGMDLSPCLDHVSAAAILGSYESALHPVIEACVERGYRDIINIGCSFGYYAVGLARRLPQATVYAFDANTDLQAACLAVAHANRVSDRIHVSGFFDGSQFNRLPSDRSLVLCDVEGAELDILDPAQYPALLGVDVIVELHECLRPGVTEALLSRFATTHDIELIEEGNAITPPSPHWASSLGAVERFILCHGGGRVGPTPWAYLRAR